MGKEILTDKVEKLERAAKIAERMLVPFCVAMTLLAALIATVVLCTPAKNTALFEPEMNLSETAVVSEDDFIISFLPKKEFIKNKTPDVETPDVETPDVETEFLTGIDISQNQGKIDITQTASAVEFAVIRIGYSGYTNGKCVLDTRFYEYMSIFSGENVPIALYWASHSISSEDVKRENEFILNALSNVPAEKLENVTYLFIDREDVMKKNSRTYLIDKGLFNQVLKEQIDSLESLLPEKVRVGVYTTRDYLINKVDKELIGDIPYWVAWWCPKDTDTSSFDAVIESVSKKCASCAEYLERNIVMWQYSAKGEVNGITENVVDMNVVSSKVLH